MSKKMKAGKNRKAAPTSGQLEEIEGSAYKSPKAKRAEALDAWCKGKKCRT